MVLELEFQRGAVVGDVHYVEEAVFLHGLEEEGVNVGVVVEEVLVGNPGHTIEYVFILFRPQPEITFQFNYNGYSLASLCGVQMILLIHITPEIQINLTL